MSSAGGWIVCGQLTAVVVAPGLPRIPERLPSQPRSRSFTLDRSCLIGGELAPDQLTQQVSRQDLAFLDSRRAIGRHNHAELRGPREPTARSSG